MSNVDISGLRKKRQAVIKRIAQNLPDATLEKIAKESIRRMVGDTRLQRGYDEKPLKKIKSSTIESKKYFKKYNSPGRNYGDNKSNLTRSGQLLEAIRYRLAGKKIRLYFKPERTPYNTSKGRGRSTAGNDLISTYLEAKGFKFFGLSPSNIKNIKKIATEKIIEVIREVRRRI